MTHLVTLPQQVPPAPLTDCFNLMPGLVIDYYGTPAIVTEVSRDIDREVVLVNVNTPDGDFALPMSWAQPHMVRVIGLAVDCEPDNIDLFQS